MHDFFVVSTTVIPVLLVAGAMRSDVLRMHAISKLSAVILEIEVVLGIVGTLAAIYGVGFAAEDSLAETICRFLTIAGLSAASMYIWVATHQALHHDPPPARLLKEKRGLENRLAEIAAALDDDRS